MSKWQQGRIINQQITPNEEVPSKLVDTDALQQGKAIENQLADISSQTHPLESEIETLTAPSQKNWLARVFWLSLSVLMLCELFISLMAVYSSSPLLAGIYALVIASFFLLIGRTVYREIRLLMQLKSTKIRQLDADRLMHSVQLGEAKLFLTKLNKAVPNQQLTELLQTIEPHHTDGEVMELYSKTVLSAQDKQAQAVIKKFAATSGIMVAISPIALVDMAVVLWRSIKMIEEITQIYGLPLGYISRIRLYRLTLKQMVFAGSAELISDFATTAFSAELTGKLSARAAQGVSVSIFTGRIGYKAMELSRPAPGLPNKQNLLSACVRLAMDSVKSKKTDGN